MPSPKLLPFPSFCQQESHPSHKSRSSSPSKDVCATSHGMTSSELGQVIRADHDYIELLVKVKAEEESEEEQEIPEEVGDHLDIKEEVIEHETEKPEVDMFDNLATLAEVSLATAGRLVDKSLKREIDQARAKIKQTILPVTPEMSSKRTMQVWIWQKECKLERIWSTAIDFIGLTGIAK